MRQTITALIIVFFLGATVRSQDKESSLVSPAESGILEIDVEERNPWTSLDFPHSSKNFQFAVVAGSSGSIDKLSLLQPEFVLSLGDQIEGGAETSEEWTKQWEKFELAIAPLKMPFFFCAGERDIPNASLGKDWHRKFGRSYYSFRYQDVLFLVLNTEDLPTEAVPYQIGTAQQRWAIEQLNNNRDARWTFVIMHKPTWTFTKKEHHLGKLGWESIEDALQGRSYTVFSGHVGKYARYERKGMEYYHLGTTDDDTESKDDDQTGRLDHIVWVTMQEDAPVVADVNPDGELSTEFRTLPDPKREK